jgi:probable F420-dependent oxidoreductase
MTLKFIFQYPETSGLDGDMMDSGPLDEVAVAAERAGFSGFSLTEHPAPGVRWLDSGGHQSLDALVALGFVAAATSTLRLLTYLVVAPYRNPFVLAKAASTVDKLSGGRLTLGLGAGYLKGEFFALGVDMARRNEIFDEVLDALPLHWKGEPFSYEGHNFSARDIIARPRPVQDPIPIWIGGNSKLSRHRVATKAQGWMPMLASAEVAATSRTPAITSLQDVADRIVDIRAESTALGRTDELDFLYSYSDTFGFTPGQDADRHREAFRDVEQAGLTWAVVSCPRGEPAQVLDFIEEVGNTYLQKA